MGSPHFNYDEEFWSKMRELLPQPGGMDQLLLWTSTKTKHGNPLNKETIYRRAKERGIRTFEASKRDCNQETLIKDYFRVLNEENIYWLGYLWADGSVALDSKSKNPQTLHLHCATADEHHIINLRNRLGSNHEIHRGKRISFGKELDYTHIAITCQEMVLDLINLWGIIPNKSELDLPWPSYIPDSYLHHFCRGVFDGDGSAGKKEYSYDPKYQSVKRWLYWKGSSLFMEGLRKSIQEAISGLTKLNLQGDPNSLKCKILNYQSLDDIRRIYEWMYEVDNSNNPKTNLPYLPRKLNVVKISLGLGNFSS